MRPGKFEAHEEEGKFVAGGRDCDIFRSKNEDREATRKEQEETHQESFQLEIRGRCRERKKEKRSG